MSKWRREAIEHIPLCKRSIEISENPVVLCKRLFEELESAYSSYPPRIEVIEQIYRYVLSHWGQKGQPDLYYFFNEFPGSNALQEDLANRLTHSEFARLEKVLAYDSTPDEVIQDLRKRFMAAKHQQKKHRS